MSTMLDLQKKILTDPDTRKEFAADPVAFLRKAGVSIPPGVQLPATIPLEAFEQQIAQVGERLAKRGVNIHDLTSDQLGKGLLNEAELEVVAGGSGGIGDVDTATIVAVGLVAVAVAAWTWAYT